MASYANRFLSDNNNLYTSEVPSTETVVDTATDTAVDTGANATINGWAEKALSTVWDAATNASTASQTQNKSAKALEDLLGDTDPSSGFNSTLQEYISKGFSTDEATAKATEAFRSKIDASSMDDTQKETAYKYLEEAAKPLDPTQDPGSFEFFMDQFKNTDEGKAILQDMYHGQNEYVSSSLFDQQRDEVTQQSGLLDSLIDQSQTGTGLFSPVSFKIAGQEVSFVPKALRAQAAQEAGLGQQKVDNAIGLFGSGYALDKIIQDATQFKASDQNVDQARDAQEPGVLDYLKAVPVVGGALVVVTSFFGF